MSELQALVAWDGEERVVVAAYVVEDGRAELVTLDALREGAGVGRRLIEAVAEAARAQGARELVVMTTNDCARSASTSAPASGSTSCAPAPCPAPSTLTG